MPKPRNPCEKEVNQLAKDVLTQTGADYSTIDQEEKTNMKRLVKEASIAVFDNYAADQTDYAGKLMMVVWPSSPDMYEVYIWRNGQLTRVGQAEELQPRGNGGTRVAVNFAYWT
jgi:hypothetical protein